MRFRFHLGTLFLLVLVASLLSLLLRVRIANRPVQFQSYSLEALEQNLGAGRMVMVSIGAAWCQHGRLNQQMISREMGYPLRKHDIVALEADWTRPSKEVQALMESLGVQTIPALAIFSPAAHESPVILTDRVGRTQVLEAIQQSSDSGGTLIASDSRKPVQGSAPNSE